MKTELIATLCNTSAFCQSNNLSPTNCFISIFKETVIIYKMKKGIFHLKMKQTKKLVWLPSAEKADEQICMKNGNKMWTGSDRYFNDLMVMCEHINVVSFEVLQHLCWLMLFLFPALCSFLCYWNWTSINDCIVKHCGREQRILVFLSDDRAICSKKYKQKTRNRHAYSTIPFKY